MLPTSFSESRSRFLSRPMGEASTTTTAYEQGQNRSMTHRFSKTEAHTIHKQTYIRRGGTFLGVQCEAQVEELFCERRRDLWHRGARERFGDMEDSGPRVVNTGPRVTAAEFVLVRSNFKSILSGGFLFAREEIRLIQKNRGRASSCGSIGADR